MSKHSIMKDFEEDISDPQGTPPSENTPHGGITSDLLLQDFTPSEN